jgi:hypothetical protein
MTDKASLELASKSQVAVQMAETIIISIENKSWDKITRDQYLRTVVQCVDALNGINPTAR